METWYVMAVDTDHKFKSRQDGNVISGIRLLLQDPDAVCSDSTRFRGLVWLEQFISTDRLQKLNVQPLPGDMIQIIFNRYGDISDIKIL